MIRLILFIGRNKFYPYICLFLVMLAFLYTNPLETFDKRYAISLIGAICGLLCVVLLAKRKNSGNIVGMMAASAESTANVLGNNIGVASLSVFYFISHIYGLVNWRKNQNNNKVVKVRQLKENHFLATLVFLILATFFNIYLTEQLNVSNTSYQLIANCFIFGLGIIAQLLLMMRFSFNWYLWIILNVLTVALNIYTNNPVIATQYLIYLFNAIYGVCEWKVDSKQTKD
ncbi:nicotinamide riboside transporter PnuC [Frischella perrara]|uniref:Nicotinamide riboside transporter PnuC n=1 Tax=Frischella perrara TaxID=1267021 RepID=A0A0A7RY03_FRIPE|nr:nicotinamide riboside transporter PnuC [Frischella perrara]AJA44210.1 nicotinamide mononucleotide transporter PnuC [Frischella perrara]MCT6874696.1 nicotinamide riboside transporter PnuC [Frischella perrara]PWV63896.1 nicotinamide mononucleotide transporter [Frischella perrara]PXY96542.1 hypothetical protein DKK76_01755 [Frischella perrara]